MNRLEIAARVLAGLYANPNCTSERDAMITEALVAADELLRQEAEIEPTEPVLSQITIILADRFSDTYAQVEGDQTIWGIGEGKCGQYTALGYLLMTHAEKLGIKIDDLREPVNPGGAV